MAEDNVIQEGEESALADIGVTQGAWTKFIRRARLDDRQKMFCLMVGSYANSNGTGIYCSIATLAVDCRIGYSTARRYHAWVRGAGLLELVRRRNRRRGKSDEYRLTIAADTVDRLAKDGIEVLDPDQYQAAKDELQETNSVGQKTRRTRDQRSPIASADPSADEPPTEQPAAGSALSNESAKTTEPDDRSALTLVSAETPISAHGPASKNTDLPVSTDLPTNKRNLRTEVAVSRARGPDEPEINLPLSFENAQALRARGEPIPRCPHGLPNALREDDTHGCFACRGTHPTSQRRANLCEHGMPFHRLDPTAASCGYCAKDQTAMLRPSPLAPPETWPADTRPPLRAVAAVGAARASPPAPDVPDNVIQITRPRRPH